MTANPPHNTFVFATRSPKVLPDAGAYLAVAADDLGTPIAKRIIAVHSHEGQYLFHTTNYDAYMRVQDNLAVRVGDKAIQLYPLKTNIGKATWVPLQSGYAGPLVLQLQT